LELYLRSPDMPLWHGAQLKKAQEQLYLYLNRRAKPSFCWHRRCDGEAV